MGTQVIGGVGWAGTRILDGLPVQGRRVPAHWVADDSLYWSYDEDIYDS